MQIPAPERYEFRGVRRDGRQIWLEGRFRRITWGGESAVQSTVIDITDRKAVEEKLNHLATHHVLTGLPNRHMFSELLSEGFDISAGTKSQGYEAMVNTRGLIVIENEDRLAHRHTCIVTGSASVANMRRPPTS